ncbi:hypothetical protein P9139_08375 [Curtobacterium flaccumfaciens]|nr:hypothetical protein P9139_08375 [Curtobacterium flaccumfaciens]
MTSTDDDRAERVTDARSLRLHQRSGAVLVTDPARSRAPAVRAYAAATIRERSTTPSCRLGWTMLAAIGAIETHHGTVDAASLADDGRASPRITGLPLDGGDVSAVPDTDGGGVDGDARWDRAVGPMQFIPQTWADRGADGDGAADPDDIDDAAAYLRADGHDLADHRGWIDAVGSYNHHEDYVRSVADEANRLAAA